METYVPIERDVDGAEVNSALCGYCDDMVENGFRTQEEGRYHDFLNVTIECQNSPINEVAYLDQNNVIDMVLVGEVDHKY